MLNKRNRDRHEVGFMRNKRAMSVSIVVLVLATLVLTVFALFSFVIKDTNIQSEILMTRFLEDMYSHEQEINFNINMIIQGINAKNKDEFISNLKSELTNSKIPELVKLESQVNSDSVKQEGKIFAIEFSIFLENKVDLGKDGIPIYASYSYKKTFEKELG